MPLPFCVGCYRNCLEHTVPCINSTRTFCAYAHCEHRMQMSSADCEIPQKSLPRQSPCLFDSISLEKRRQLKLKVMPAFHTLLKILPASVTPCNLIGIVAKDMVDSTEVLAPDAQGECAAGPGDGMDQLREWGFKVGLAGAVLPAVCLKSTC